MARLILQCAPWTMRAAAPFAGVLQANTSQLTSAAILVGSNTFDPIAPLADAKADAGRYGGAVLLQQASFGHAVTLNSGTCAQHAIGQFFPSWRLTDCGDGLSTGHGAFRWGSQLNRRGVEFVNENSIMASGLRFMIFLHCDALHNSAGGHSFIIYNKPALDILRCPLDMLGSILLNL